MKHVSAQFFLITAACVLCFCSCGTEVTRDNPCDMEGDPEAEDCMEHIEDVEGSYKSY